MDDESQALMISALQHYAFCPRQFALIHVEQVWSENYFTAHGQALHERVDSQEPEKRGNVRFERGVAVMSSRLGLRGKLDLLEIEGDPPEALFPVEYKRGKPKVENWDKIQLCAQALCLEEMRSVDIESGALWYWQVRKREPVAFDDSLRQQTLSAIEAAKALLVQGHTPLPTEHPGRCRACSLIDLCAPDTFRKDHSRHYIKDLFAE